MTHARATQRTRIAARVAFVRSTLRREPFVVRRATLVAFVQRTRIVTRTLVACVALATTLGACADDPPSRGAHASTIVVDGDTVLVTSPDDDAVVALDATTLVERARLVIAGAPTKLARLDDSPEGAGALVVSLAQAAEVAWVDGAVGGFEDARIVRVPVPCGGTGAVLALSASDALVACPHDDRLVHLRDAAVVSTYASSGRPTALARTGDRIYVGLSRAGSVRVLDATTLAAIEERTLESTPGVAAVQLDAFATDGDAPIASYQRVDFDRDRTRDPRLGGYGAVVDGAPRLEPRLLAPCGGRYARFDGSERVASGPSALAFDAARRRLWIAHRQTGNVVLVACGPSSRTGLAAPSDREARVLGAVYVGRGLEGLALDDDGSVFVDVAFDHAIARLREVEGALSIVTQRTRSLGPTAMSAAALRGRALFHDARDTQLTPSGVVTCASCHPGGGEDGLAWFLHTTTVGPKLRRTPPAWGARPSLAPYHWDGEHESAQELTLGTIRALLEGDGLLVELDAIAAYLEELAPPPPRPADAPAAAARGRTLFDARCASCHPGGGSDGLAHPIVPASDDAAASLERAFTPTLQAVRARPPYLHDGRAATLRDALTTADPDSRHGAADLSAPDLDDLVAYLETL